MKPQPKVLFVTPSAYVLSGLATWLDYLQPGLNERGWSCVLGLVEGPVFHRSEQYLAVHPSARMITIPCATGTAYGRCRAMVKTIEQEEPDIIVSVNIPDIFATIRHLRTSGRKTPASVMTIHGIQADLFGDLAYYGDSIDALIATNRLSCSLARGDAKMESERVLYAPYGVEIPKQADRDGRDARFRIVYSGRLEQPQKRIHDIPLMLQQLDRSGMDYVLDIAGSGPEEDVLRAALRSQIDGGRVRFLGFVSAEKLSTEVYAGADALVVLSSWETGPIVIWEAMSHQVPVITSRYVGSGQEGALMHEHNALLFAIGDAETAAEHIIRLSKDLDLGRKLVANGLALVQERYSIEASVRQWDAALRAAQALAKRAPQTPMGFATHGRLDRLAGVRLAEFVRVLCGRSLLAADPGGEWPHAHAAWHGTDAEFWEIAEKMDARED